MLFKTILILLIFPVNILFSQSHSVIKINLLSRLIKTYNIQYEYLFKSNRSFQVGFYYTNDEDNNLDNGIGVTPEFRIYFNNDKSFLAGSYIAPFFRYQNVIEHVYLNDGNYRGSALVNCFRPGVIVGYHKIFDNMGSLDLFLGSSYAFSSYRVKSMLGTKNDFSNVFYNGWGLRCGITIGFAF
jgi:hypothetical protein